MIEEVDDPFQALVRYAAIFGEAADMLALAATFDVERDLTTAENIEALRALILGARERYITAGRAILLLVSPDVRPH